MCYLIALVENYPFSSTLGLFLSQCLFQDFIHYLSCEHGIEAASSKNPVGFLTELSDFQVEFDCVL